MPKISFEGLLGVGLAFLVVILDQAGVRNGYVLWGAFFAAFVLVIVWIVCSNSSKRARFIWTMTFGVVWVMFGLYLFHRELPKPPTEGAPAQLPSPKGEAEQKAEHNPAPNAPPQKTAEPTTAPSYSISVEEIVGGIAFWVLDGNKTRLTPTRLAILLQIVNQKPVAAMIDEFTVEGIGDTNRWGRLRRADMVTEYAEIYSGNNVRDLSLIDIKLLDRQISERNLAAGETVTGWALFAVPSPVTVRAVKVVMKDTAGTRYSSGPLIPKKRESRLIQWVTLYRVLSPHHDLSSIPIQTDY